MENSKNTKQLLEEIKSLKKQINQLKNKDTTQGAHPEPVAEYFRSLFEQAPLPYQSLDANGCYLEVNKTWLEYMGYEKNEVIGRWFGDFISKEQHGVFAERFPCFKSLGMVCGVEFTMVRKDKTTFLASFDGRIGYDEKGDFKQTHCIFMDITAQKALENDLIQVKEKAERKAIELNKVQGITHIGSWYLDLATNNVVWTEELYKMYGFDSALPPPPYTEHMKLFTAESWEILSTSLARTAETGISYELELKTVRKDESNGWLWCRGEAVFDQNNKIIGLWGAAQDITERKQIELELAESVERFKALHNASFGGIAIHDKGKILECNQGLSDITGYALDELIGMDGLLLIAPESREMVMKNILAGYEKPYETIGLRKNGEQYPIRLEARNIPYKGKNVRTVEFRDITEQKKNEEILAQQAYLLGRAQEIGHTGSWDLDVVNNALKWSVENYKIFGVKQGTPLTYELFLSCVHPEDRKYVNDKWQNALNKQPYEVEHRLLIDGQVKWVWQKADLEFDEQGKCLRVVGFTQDITQAKKMQIVILDEKLLNEEYINSLPGLFYVFDEKSFIQWNVNWEKITGYSHDELSKMYGTDFFEGEDKLRIEKHMKEVFSQGHTAVEAELVLKNGKKIPYYFTGALREIKGNNYLIGLGIDITERKLLERALEKRVVAMAQPLDESADIDFDVLFNITEIQELQDLFAKSANVASLITYPDGTPITQPSNFCRLCRDIIRKTEKGAKNCACSDVLIGKSSDLGPNVRVCASAGLWDAGATIKVGGKHIANWLVGQVRNEEQDKDKIKAYAEDIGADVEEFMSAYEEVPIMSKQQFQKISDTLFVMAKQLSVAAYQNIQQARFISERKKAEDDLLSSNKRFVELFDNMSSGVAIYTAVDDGADFMFQDFNRAAEKIEKIKRSDIIGKKVTEIFPEVTKFGLFAVFQRVFKTGNPEHFADKIYKDQRIEGWRKNYVFKIPTGEIISVYDDITEQKKIEQQEKVIFAAQAAAEVERQKAVEVGAAYQELKTMQSQLLQAEKMASIGQLGAGIAHELNSPLAGILSLLRSYKKEKNKNSEEYDDLNEMEKACEHMAKIIKGLNSFSRQSTGEKEELDFNQTIRSTLHFAAYQLEKKGVSIETDFAPDLWKIKANENQIQQIIVNMLTNAADALSAQGKFKISTHNLKISDKAYVEILFKDNGCGIKAEDLNKIFDPFFTTKRPGGGVGLGLSIAYKIVETHNGTISVDSQEGQGTVFTIRLPVS